MYNHEEKKTKFFTYTIPIYIILVIIALDAILAPFLESRMIAASYYFYVWLRYICHQIPTRCIWIFGSNMALCSRCFGLFLGLLLTGIFLGLKGVKRIYWKSAIILILPAVIDGTIQFKGIWISNNYLRFISGFSTGVGSGMVLFPVYFLLISWVIKIFRKKEVIAN